MTFKAETPKNYEEKFFETVDPKMSRNIERVSSFEKYQDRRNNNEPSSHNNSIHTKTSDISP